MTAMGNEPSDTIWLASVKAVRLEGDGFNLTGGEPAVALPAIMGLVQKSGAKLERLTTRTATLEDVFVNLTGRHLRDDATA